jgi:hypothetical protein
MLIHKVSVGHAPLYLTNILTAYADVPSKAAFRAYTSDDYVVPRTHLKLGERAFSVTAPLAWNRMPTTLKLVRCFYGAEIWDLPHSDIETLCTAWRKGIRQIYQLPFKTYSALTPGLCHTLPLTDLFYKRMVNFVYGCLNCQSSLVNFITHHGALVGQMGSVLGRNVIYCSQRYNTTIKCISK